MAEEFVSVIKIETGESEMSVAELKKRISSLRDEILNLDKGTDEYAKSVTELQNAQRRLDEVMSLTKKTATALDGSYDSLVHKMSLLKKEWRATNDEAKRNELGKQIEQINTQLKEFDSSIGNHQRNVGNYTESIETALGGLETSTKSYGEAWGAMQKSTEVTRARFEGVQKTASGLASGFAAVQGVMALVGVENENLEKTFLKVQSAMAVAQGVGGLKDLVEGFTQLKTAFTGVTKTGGQAATVLAGVGGGAVAAVGGFIAVAAAAIALAGNMDKLKQKFAKTTEEQKAKKALAELNLELTKVNAQSSAEKIVRLKELSNGYKKLGDNLEDKQKYVKEFADELRTMGIEMNDVNDADNIFINNTDSYISAVMARAKADALRNKAMEDYAEYLEQRASLEVELVDAETKQAQGAPDKTFWENIGEAIIGASVYEGVSVADAQDFNDDWTAQIAQDAVDAVKGKIKALDEKIEADITKLFTEAAAQDAIADGILGSGTGKKGGSAGSSSTSSNGDDGDDIVARVKEIAERARQAVIDTKEEELAEAQRIYDEELQLLVSHGENTANLTEEYNKKVQEINKKYAVDTVAIIKEQLAQLDNAYSNASRLAAISSAPTSDKQSRGFLGSILGLGTLDDQRNAESAEKSKSDALTAQYEKEQAYLEKRKGLLQEMLQAETDPQKRLDIEQQIIDTEISMEEAKNDELNRLGEEANKKEAERQQKRQAIFAAGAQAASSLLTSIADAYESNEKTAAENEDKIKALRITAAVIDTIQGAVTAFASAQSLGPIAGPIIGGINAAAVTAMGIANINKIKNTKIGDANASVDGGGTGRATASPAAYSAENPFNYTRQVTGASEVEELNRDQRVYILESDIQASNRRVEIREQETSF